MTSINNKTNQDVYAAFNKLNKDAATNDGNMSSTVKEDATAFVKAIVTDADLSATDKMSLNQQAAALLPMAGEAGHGAEWNADMQKLVNQLSSLPQGTSTAATQNTTGASNDAAGNTTNAQVFSAYNALNSLAASNQTGTGDAIKIAAKSLLTMVQGDASLSASQHSDIETKVTNLLGIAGQTGHGTAWNSQMQALVDVLSQVAQDSAGTSTNGTATATNGANTATNSATGTAITTGASSETATNTGATTGASTTSTSVVPASTNNAALSDTTLYPSGNGPTLQDIQQGSLNDCTVDAALSSLVQNDPSSITNMIAKNADGTYDVTLFPAGVKTTVSIDPSKDLVKNGTVGSNGKADWASMVEAAAVKVGFSLDNGYGAAPGDAIQLLTGTSGMAGDTSLFGDTATLEASLQTELSSGKITIAVTPTASTVNGSTIDANHAYSVLRVEDGEVTLRNPWGNQPNNGIVKMSVADYAKAFAWTYMED